MIELELCYPCGMLFDAYNDISEGLGESLTPELLRDLCPTCLHNLRQMIGE